MGENFFPWLSDNDRAAQYLTSLTLSSAAQAAMIIRSWQLWAYAGELSQPAAHELLEAVLRNSAGKGDKEAAPGEELATGKELAPCKEFAQFAALSSTGREYLLYATRLSEDMLLALAYDVEIPFSKIRTQARRLASALKAPPGTLSLEAEELSQADSSFQSQLAPLFPLEDIPPPTPTEVTRHNESPLEGSPWQNEPQTSAALEENLRSGMGLAFGEEEDLKSPEPEYEAATPQFNIAYAFVLLPRLPAHHLAGELAIALEADMQQLAMAFGWRLERLLIRPDHVQWIARVPPNTSPSRLVRLIRKHSSQRLFSRFPHLERENPSGDFWAPGYLVMSGNQPLPAQVVISFVKQTRFQQGASA